MRWPIAKGRTRPIPGQMNKLEQSYSHYLEGLKTAGHIIQYWYPCLKLSLAPRTFYTPDFLVHSAITHELELHEVKGSFFEDDARVKIKVAQQLYPCFRFLVVRWKNKQWEYEEIG